MGGLRRYLISAATSPFGGQLETGHFVWRFYIEGLGAGHNGTIDMAVDEVVRFGFFKNAGAGENDPAAVRRMNDAVADSGCRGQRRCLGRKLSSRVFTRSPYNPRTWRMLSGCI